MLICPLTYKPNSFVEEKLRKQEKSHGTLLENTDNKLIIMKQRDRVIHLDGKP